MTTKATDTTPTTGAEDVAWDIGTLVDGEGADGARRLLDRAMEEARRLTADLKGTLTAASAAGLAGALDRLASVHEDVGRAASYAQLDFAVDTSDPARGALAQEVTERVSALEAELVWFDLEVVAIDDERVVATLALRSKSQSFSMPSTFAFSRYHRCGMS